eukprot:jgi/Chrzof1/11435/Cz05g36180.t1
MSECFQTTGVLRKWDERKSATTTPPKTNKYSHPVALGVAPPNFLHVDSLSSPLGSLSTNDRVTDTYSQLAADLLSTHVGGIKHFQHQQAKKPARRQQKYNRPHLIQEVKVAFP